MIYKFFVKLINNKEEKIDDDYDRNYQDLINRYLLLLFLIFLFYSVFIIIFFGDMLSSVFLIVITFFWLFLMAIKGKTKRFGKILRPTIISIFVLLTFIVSFFNIYTYKNA